MTGIQIGVITTDTLVAAGLDSIIRDGLGAAVSIQHYWDWRYMDQVKSTERPQLVILDDGGLHMWEVVTILDAYEKKPLKYGIIVLSERSRREYVLEVLKRPKATMIFKDDRLPNKLKVAIHAMRNGEVLVGADVTALAVQREKISLTFEQRQVIDLMAMDFPVKVIAEVMGPRVTPDRVYKIQGQLRLLLNVMNTSALVDAARREGLLDG